MCCPGRPRKVSPNLQGNALQFATAANVHRPVHISRTGVPLRELTSARQEENMATALKIAPPEEKVSSFVSKTHKILINGKWVEAASGKTFATYNPATGEVLAHVAEGDREDIDRAVKAARNAFEKGPWAKISPSERGRMMWRLADLLEENLEEFAELESLDNGKPLKIARAADVPL